MLRSDNRDPTKRNMGEIFQLGAQAILLINRMCESVNPNTDARALGVARKRQVGELRAGHLQSQDRLLEIRLATPLREKYTI